MGGPSVDLTVHSECHLMHLSWKNSGKEPEQLEPAHSGHVPTTGADSYEKTLPFGDPESFQRKKAGIVVLPHRFENP